MMRAQGGDPSPQGGDLRPSTDHVPARQELPGWWAQAALVFMREWRTEWRRPEMVLALAVYGLLLVVLFSLAVNPLAVDVRPVAPGLLWLGFFFAAISGFQRSYSRERAEGALQGLRVAPLDATALFYGKLAFGLLLLVVTEAVVTPIFLSLVNVQTIASVWGLVGSLALGTLGLAALAAQASALATGVRAGEALLPLLALPLLAPLALGGVHLTQAAITGDLTQWGLWVQVLGAYDIIFLVLPVSISQFLMEE